MKHSSIVGRDYLQGPTVQETTRGHKVFTWFCTSDKSVSSVESPCQEWVSRHPSEIPTRLESFGHSDLRVSTHSSVPQRLSPVGLDLTSPH